MWYRKRNLEILHIGLNIKLALYQHKHFHPSGDPKPSQDDINATTNLTGILSTMGITVLDHIVIGRNDFSSLKQLGMFPGMQQSIREQDVKYGTRSLKDNGKCR